MNGLRYVLAIIDDLSIFTWVYFLKKKSEVFEKFKDFKAFAEIATRRKIKSLKSDNGGEYTKSELLYICVENGINIQHIVPYTPQENSVAERKKRALKEMTTSILEYKYLDANMWVEAMNFVAYIQNRVPYSFSNPNVFNLMLFGSTRWARIPLDKRKYLEPQSVECIVIGYDE